MKIITLKQPWASLIADGIKTVETRTHDKFKNLVGQTIGIHAGKSFDLLPMNLLLESRINSSIGAQAIPQGVILCVANVDDAKWVPDDEFSAQACCPTADRFCLFLSNIRKLKNPVPAKGSLGIWEYNLNEGDLM